MLWRYKVIEMYKNIIEYLERLVLIEFTEDEKERIEKEIEKIIEMFNTLNVVENLDQWEPLYHVHDISLSLREDEATEGIDGEHTTLQSNAILIDKYVKAPRTVSE